MVGAEVWGTTEPSSLLGVAVAEPSYNRDAISVSFLADPKLRRKLD